MSRLRACVLIILAAAIPMPAQLTGQLTGTIVDPSSAAVGGAKASLFLPGGETALLSTTTNSDGIFDFIGVRPDLYMLVVESPGFTKYTLAGVKVDPAKRLALPVIALSLASSAQTVDVVSNVQGVDTATAEVATTVSQAQITNLPVVGRQIANLFVTQAGVTQNLRQSTVINGMRPSFSNLLMDGILVQDSVRTNNLDNIPNRFTIAQVAEFTVSTTNSSPTIGGAASTITMVTPSGSNQLHGSGYWFNRNRYFSANDWFNNKNGTNRPALNLNQAGGTLGGAVIKDKLFFWGNYEAYRLKRQVIIQDTILTPTARQGILQYRVGNEIRQFDVMKAAGIPISPYMKSLLDLVPAAGNNTGRGDGLNTTGYSFNARSNTTRDNITGKVDYNVSPRHVFSGTYIWNRDIPDRTVNLSQYTVEPPYFNDNRGRLVSTTWRWTPTATLTNELRGGINFTSAPFKLNQVKQPYYLQGAALLFGTPYQLSQLGEGRNIHQYNIQDNANWLHGKHAVAFGFQSSLLRTSSYNYNGSASTNSVTPVYTIGLSQASGLGFTTGDTIPGASGTFVTTANNLLATLGGVISGGGQYFNVTSRSSGFVAGAPSIQNQKFDQFAFYALDNFRLTRRLTLTLGLRWDYFQPVDETGGLAITPVLINNNPVETLLGNATLDFAGTSAGRPFYKKDRNNFAPNIALAWDPSGSGKTSIRAGFNIAYVNDNFLNSVYNAISQNNGLSSARQVTNLNARADNPPPIPAPPFQVPTTSRAQFDLSPTSPPVEGIMDPNLATPYVSQWNLSIQREVKGGFILEGRYVGNHAIKMLRQLDYNQINVNQAGFLEDFIRARNNGFLAQAAGKGFVAAHDPSIPGSQPLTFFPLMPNGGSLTSAAVTTPLRTGEAGSLAQVYQNNLLFPASIPGFSFFPNPLLLYASMMTNRSSASYNGLQLEVRKRTRNGFQFQANYTFSKALTDSNAFRALDAQLDNASSSVERARADYDQTHAFKLNHYVPLPIGSGHRLSSRNGVVKRIIDGWGLSGFLAIYSGSPVSVLSARGTLNRAARSSQNTVDTILTGSQLKEITGLFMTGNGPSWINPDHVGPDSFAVAADGSAPFSGQVFFNPQPGKLGSFQKRYLDGPNYWNYNFSVVKNIRLTERHTLEFHFDFFNVFNHPNFYLSDQNVNNPSFGRITQQNYSNDGVGPRVVQYGLYYRF
ncbi:MAG TPA: TonB-dependent receptor [Bryobacteraceae bacterium]|nr:TonB-dependent receptor [Bryobacteraceae bacterium]